MTLIGVPCLNSCSSIVNGLHKELEASFLFGRTLHSTPDVCELYSTSKTYYASLAGVCVCVCVLTDVI